MSSRSSLRLRREEHDLPNTVDGIIGLVRDILSSGDVYKFVLESGHSVLVYRQTEGGDLTEVEVTLDDALQRAEFYEYGNEGASPFEVLFDMMHVISTCGGHAVCWATGMDQTNLLANWLTLEERGLPTSSVEEILGIPVCRMKVLPEDTLVLCAARRRDGEIEDVSLAVKAAIELRGVFDVDSGSDADREGGDHPGGDPEAAGDVEDAAAGGPRGGWIPRSVVGGVGR